MARKNKVKNSESEEKNAERMNHVPFVAGIILGILLLGIAMVAAKPYLNMGPPDTKEGSGDVDVVALDVPIGLLLFFVGLFIGFFVARSEKIGAKAK